MRPIPEIAPVIGAWYRRPDRDQPFQVVACDAQAATVDVEYYDGTVDEWPMTHWRALQIVPSEQPQGSSGPFDSAHLDGMAEDDAGCGPSLDLEAAVSRAILATPDLDP